jgi:tRNA(Ile)-lysidine synthase TilS/MesJ
MHSGIEGIIIDENGLCNQCKSHKAFNPHGEKHLIAILEKAKNNPSAYNALVPLSGGKDSTYVLYLAVKKYGLKVLVYSYDNGFMSQMAKDNIQNALKECGSDHIWVKHDAEMLRKLYRTTLVNSGEICGVCGVGIERSMLKLTEAYKIPIILLGHSPTEANSFSKENIYDPNRLKSILKTNPKIEKDEIKRFFVYPELNFITSFLYTKTGKFGRKINLLYYPENPSDKEISKIIKKEMGWKEPEQYEYTRHFDCKAEPFTNYIREKRIGSSRRLPQLCNMIRNNEISREEALKIYETDSKKVDLTDYDSILNDLKIDKEELKKIEKIPLYVFNENLSKANKIFARVRKLLKAN